MNKLFSKLGVLLFVTALLLLIIVYMHDQKIHNLEMRVRDLERIIYLPYRTNEAYKRDEALIEKQLDKILENDQERGN